MRGLWLCGAIILGSAALAACQPYGYRYGNGYYGYDANGYYGQYGYQQQPAGGYAYGPAGAYPPGYPMAPASYAVPQALSQTSYNFVINAALSDSYEIQAARLAAAQSDSPDIRRFADRMANDHTMTTQQLAATLQRNGTPVVTPGALDPRHQAMIGDLGNVRGPEFDRRYVIQQVTAHREAVAMLQSYAQNGDNPALRQLAAQTLPMVQEHLRMAQALPGAAGV